MAQIVMDYREDKKFVREFVKAKVECDVRQLVVGDFVLKTKNLEGEIRTVGIERKTQQDFLNSVIDRRLFNQLLMLKEHVDIPLLLVEGTENLYALRDFHPNAIRGVLATVAVDLQIPVLHTQNVRDSAHMIVLLANRLEKTRSPLVLTAKPKRMSMREQQEFLVASLPGVGPVIGKNLLRELKSIRNIANASEKELQKVEKVGKEKSAVIRRVFDEGYEER